LKAFAFFLAIIMTVWYGVQLIKAMDKEDAIKTARTGIINVLSTLVFIKVIDFIFFIAQDVSFVSKAKNFMINIARIAGYILGAAMVFALIYAGYKYLSAQGDEKEVGQAKKTITSMFYVVLIVFLFLLVGWQLIATFA
jgi:Type IV secretion system pilin